MEIIIFFINGWGILMENVGKIVALVLLVLGVAGYSVYNYLIGRTGLDMLVVSLLILSWPMVNIFTILIRDWKNKK